MTEPGGEVRGERGPRKERGEPGDRDRNDRGSPEPLLTRDRILHALGQLDRALAERGVVGEICLYGGAVMVLAYEARLATRDVDAVFRPAALLRELAGKVAEACALPGNWLNDGVKGFLSARGEAVAGNLPQFPSLRLTMPAPQYLLAMKCMAARVGIQAGEADDTADIRFLIRRLGLATADDVLRIVEEYYPSSQVPAKTRFLVESLFEEGGA